MIDIECTAKLYPEAHGQEATIKIAIVCSVTSSWETIEEKCQFSNNKILN